MIPEYLKNNKLETILIADRLSEVLKELPHCKVAFVKQQDKEGYILVRHAGKWMEAFQTFTTEEMLDLIGYNS